METDKKHIGERIRRFLVEAKVKQKELAKRIGLPESTTSLIINGDRFARPDTLAKIADALGVSLDWLITGKDREKVEHSDPALEGAVKEHAEGWGCKGEEFSETEQRIIGMLRRLSPEMRQVHFDGITDSYFLAMEREMEKRANKD